MQVVIIGGGMSGISTAIRLREFCGDRVGITVSAPFSSPHPKLRSGPGTFG